MTSLLERAISGIAPHCCIVCSNENNVLCDGCSFDLFGQALSQCFLCQSPTADFAVCRQCRKTTELEHVWTAGSYEGAVAQLIKALKFERVVAAAQPLGQAMARTLPYVPANTVLVPVPTAPSRIRQRGYDQAVLLTRELSRASGLEMRSLLLRLANSRQVGATKHQRATQVAHAFQARGSDLQGLSVILVDDVVTTGATLRAAARTLHEAGAQSVDAIVVARSV